MRKRTKINTVGVVVGAVLASACCWLPLLLVALGASTLGFASFFESARPWFLGGTAVLLFWAVVLSLRSKSNTEDCCNGESKTRSAFMRVPWVLILVAGSALYLPPFLLAGNHPQGVALGEQSWLLSLPANTDLNPVEQYLRSTIPDLKVQKSSSVHGELLLSISREKAESVAGLIQESLDSVLGGNQKSEIHSLDWQTFGVDGLTCDACVLHVENALNGTDGVLSSQVDLKEGSASLLTLPSFDSSNAKQAVAAAGYHLQELVESDSSVPTKDFNSDLLSGCCASDQ